MAFPGVGLAGALPAIRIKLRNGDNENTYHAWFYSLSSGNRSEFPLKKADKGRFFRIEQITKRRKR